jgi:hypothetical protein
MAASKAVRSTREMDSRYPMLAGAGGLIPLGRMLEGERRSRSSLTPSEIGNHDAGAFQRGD